MVSAFLFWRISRGFWDNQKRRNISKELKNFIESIETIEMIKPLHGFLPNFDKNFLEKNNNNNNNWMMMGRNFHHTKFLHLWSDIFARLKRVTFKLGKFTYCKAFAWLLSLDFLWLLLIERKKITRGCIIDNWNFSKASESILFRFLFISRSWPPSEWPPLWYKTNGSNCRRRRSHSTFMALASGDSCEGSKQRAIVLQVWWDSGNASVCCNSGALCFPDSLSRIIWNMARWGWYKLSCQSVKFRSN